MNPFPPFNRVKPCRYGTMLYNVHDRYVGRSLELYGEYSEGEADLFRQALGPGEFAVEVGANVGAHTLVLAQAVGPRGRVLAFEPQRVVFQALCANLALNSVTNVDCRQAAVGAAPGELLVPPLDYTRENNFGGLSLAGHVSGEPVPVVTLDELSLRRCDLLKVDVEGMEREVLAGAEATVRRLRPLLYVENDRPEKAEALIRAIDALGYRIYWHVVPLFNPDNFAGNPENVFGRTASLNLFCCPQDSACQVRGVKPLSVPR